MPWLAKTVGAVVTGATLLGRSNVILVFMRGDVGTGTQAEWTCREDLQKRLHVDSTIPLQVKCVVVDPAELCEAFGHDHDALRAAYSRGSVDASR